MMYQHYLKSLFNFPFMICDATLSSDDLVLAFYCTQNVNSRGICVFYLCSFHTIRGLNEESYRKASTGPLFESKSNKLVERKQSNTLQVVIIYNNNLLSMAFPVSSNHEPMTSVAFFHRQETCWKNYQKLEPRDCIQRTNDYNLICTYEMWNNLIKCF